MFDTYNTELEIKQNAKHVLCESIPMDYEIHSEEDWFHSDFQDTLERFQKDGWQLQKALIYTVGGNTHYISLWRRLR